jgi:diguanylate cyclase (GGDEF)-like protein
LSSVFTWRISNQLAGEHFSHWLIPYWNTLIRLGVFVVVTILLAQLRSVLEKERALARTDSLTGALNRRAFFERVEAEILRSRRYQRPFTIAYIDLDGFKSINDQFGHSTGDALLVSVVQVIDENLRRGDLFARLGGDEFAILLLETDQVLAPIVVSRLQKAILNQMQQNQWSVTLSIGVLTYLKPPHSVDEMIRSADRLMYTVKSTSKNAIKYSAYMG